MKGLVLQWDVMNEPFDNHDLIDILGKDEIAQWFKLARAADPDAKLFINDYAILSGGGGETPHRNHYEGTIRFMVDQGAPFDGIGMQGHFGTSLTAPEDLLALLDRFAKFNKTIYITEYDIVLDDEQLAADYTRDFYTALMSHPAVGGIFMWGFWDGSHWKKNSAMYRTDCSMKPAGKAYSRLVFDEWRTRARGQTDAQGVFSARGFLGSYSVEVSAAGKKKVLTTRLSRGGSSVVVKLD